LPGLPGLISFIIHTPAINSPAKPMTLCSACEQRFNNIPTNEILKLYTDSNSAPTTFNTSNICEGCLNILSPIQVKSTLDNILKKLSKYEISDKVGATTYHLNIYIPFSISIVRQYLVGHAIGSKEPECVMSVRGVLYQVLSVLLQRSLPTLSLLSSDDVSAMFCVDFSVQNLAEAQELELVLPSTARPAKRQKKRRTEKTGDHLTHANINTSFDRVQVLRAVRNYVVATGTTSSTTTNKNSLENIWGSGYNITSLSSSSSPPMTTHYLSVSRHSTFIEGNYIKNRRGLTQTPWFCDGKRIGGTSVQEMLCNSLILELESPSHKFHSAGREDMDVRMLGNGRPFVIECINSIKDPSLKSTEWFNNIEERINSENNEDVVMKNLRVGVPSCMSDMLDGAEFKKKTYSCLVQLFGRKPNINDINLLNNINDLKVMQQTPIRVLHRRTQMEREKTIHWMKCEEIPDTCCFILQMCTSAGAYVKEIVHGGKFMILFWSLFTVFF
jgi:tRNA U54 and U55 pseudouridine synthase Pus10